MGGGYDGKGGNGNTWNNGNGGGYGGKYGGYGGSGPYNGNQGGAGGSFQQRDRSSGANGVVGNRTLWGEREGGARGFEVARDRRWFAGDPRSPDAFHDRLDRGPRNRTRQRKVPARR